ncbi:MAG: hypothetical protein MI673_07355 [Thiotrichales bacterium]|nr:hypothetical protein [Thiotrichales bacterium]
MLEQIQTNKTIRQVPTGHIDVGGHVRAKLESSSMEGFIRHPRAFPMDIRRVWFERGQGSKSRFKSDLGLCFSSEKYIPTGAILEVTIPLRGEEQKFKGKVVLVRNRGACFDIGIWLDEKADAHRARMVEQICHIETYLRDKHRREGPFVSREKVAEEWITRFAASFP